jgi:hypothetical protein
MAFNIPLADITASDGNVTYAQTTVLKVGQGSNITVSAALFESNGIVTVGTISQPITSTANLIISGTGAGGIELVSGNSGGGNITPLAGGGMSFSTFTGAIGSEIYTAAMNIDTFGNLLVGTNTVLYPNPGRKSISLSGSCQSLFALATGGTARGYWYTDGTNNYINSDANGGSFNLGTNSVNPIVFTVNSSTKATISSAGQLLIGTSLSPSGTGVNQIVYSASGGGMQLAYGLSGGASLSALNGGGLNINTYTGIVGSEAYTTRMTVTSAGSVGIGTSTVNSGNSTAIYGGNLFIAGNVRISNTATQLGGIQFADGTFQATAGGGGGGGLTQAKSIALSMTFGF